MMLWNEMAFIAICDIFIPYDTHANWCEVNDGWNCDCGLDDAMEDIIVLTSIFDVATFVPEIDVRM